MSDASRTDSTAILVTRNGMGTADPELAHKLAGTYFGLLELEGHLPRAICFYAEGVHLTVEGSPILEELRGLADKGVELIVCGTCANFYRITDKVRIGRIGSMKDIVAVEMENDRIITI